MTDNNECRILINIPADENYIEILGHRIDGFESFEAFLEHLKKYAELEETVYRQKAEIEKLTKMTELDNSLIEELKKAFNDRTAELQEAEFKIKELNSIRSRLIYDSGTLTKISDELYQKIKAEAVEEFAERFKVRAWVDKTLLGFPYYQITFRTFNNLVKEMVGEH